jgi:cytochrome oxidase Cu insertion factor (SCO1/SenC/PrrC family)
VASPVVVQAEEVFAEEWTTMTERPFIRSFALLLALLLAPPAAASEPARAAPLAGELAPDVVLTTSQGELRLAALAGRPLVLFFSFPG